MARFLHLSRLRCNSYIGFRFGTTKHVTPRQTYCREEQPLADAETHRNQQPDLRSMRNLRPQIGALWASLLRQMRSWWAHRKKLLRSDNCQREANQQLLITLFVEPPSSPLYHTSLAPQATGEKASACAPRPPAARRPRPSTETSRTASAEGSFG